MLTETGSGQRANQAASWPADQPTSELVKQPISQPANQPAGWLANQPGTSFHHDGNPSKFSLKAEAPFWLCFLGNSMWSVTPHVCFVLCACVLNDMLCKHQQLEPSMCHNDSYSRPCSGPLQGEPSQMEAALVSHHKRSYEAPFFFFFLFYFVKNTHPWPRWGRVARRCGECGVKKQAVVVAVGGRGAAALWGCK